MTGAAFSPSILAGVPRLFADEITAPQCLERPCSEPLRGLRKFDDSDREGLRALLLITNSRQAKLFTTRQKSYLAAKS
jgi:hypothetical protein